MLLNNTLILPKHFSIAKYCINIISQYENKIQSRQQHLYKAWRAENCESFLYSNTMRTSSLSDYCFLQFIVSWFIIYHYTILFLVKLETLIHVELLVFLNTWYNIGFSKHYCLNMCVHLKNEKLTKNTRVRKMVHCLNKVAENPYAISPWHIQDSIYI